jgi:phosphatidylserine/phosphatidylglycerophosphate/cardiolipin synthase-like enzyme
MTNACFVEGTVAAAPFTLKVHRGEGMALLAMNWRAGTPSDDFVGFAIEYCEPESTAFFALKNRLNFEGNAGTRSSAARPPSFSTLVAPIQKFRWVHFPFNAELPGAFTYRVTPVFMNANGELHYGAAQLAEIELARETYPGLLNVAFTRGFVSSQAFVDRYTSKGPIDTLLPATSKEGLAFVPTHPRKDDAYKWMGFEARREILKTLDLALADPKAEVGIVAYDLDLPEIVDRVKKLPKSKVRVIIDDSKDHHGDGAAEDGAEQALKALGIPVRRQHMGKLQHNKTIWVSGPTVQRAVFGSTNMSWRGFFVQSNNAVIIQDKAAVDALKAAFDQYWESPGDFPKSPSASWVSLGMAGVDVSVAFSPHNAGNSVLKGIADDIDQTTSSLFYSLAFLAITPGKIREALARQTDRDDVFVAGISDKRTGIVVAASSSNLPPTYVQAFDKNAPPPFNIEPSGLAGKGVGTRMHHKFVVLDFNTDQARVYLGSYNMSIAADGSNGENLLLIRDRRVATAYMVEAISMIDHYQFRAARISTKKLGRPLQLRRPPAAVGEQSWWAEDWTEPRKIRDRLLFA